VISCSPAASAGRTGSTGRSTWWRRTPSCSAAARTCSSPASRASSRAARGPIFRLAGTAARDDAEALRGEELTVPLSDIELEADEYWAHELAGCAVVDGEVAIGFVRRMSALPSCEVLEVDRPDGSELLVPMVRDAIRSIDVAARRIDIDMAFLEG
jgi:16S rRNA processing protein RimM